MRALLRAAIGVAALAGLGACKLAHDLLPRTHTSSRSPDGRYVAFVHQKLNPDPPDGRELIRVPSFRLKAVPSG